MSVKQDPNDLNPLTTVVISVDEYVELIQCRNVLQALERAGVDNWEWYDEAISDLVE